MSESCLSIMRKPDNNCTIFDFPLYVKIVNTEPVFSKRINNRTLIRISSMIGNSLIWCLNIPNKFRLLLLKKKYKIARFDNIPQWAGDMCLNDRHKFAEYHDSIWLQWCLTHNLSGKPEDIQRFYGIFRDDKPIGFFFTKERLKKDENCNKEFLYGTICEWASIDPKLRECDIDLLAIETFSYNCFHVMAVTDNPQSEKELRRMGFLRHGCMQMGFKDKLHQFPEMKNPNLWRIRYGCCNSILV